MTCPTCAGYGHVRTIHGHAAPCPATNCRDGIVQSGPYSPECAVGCATVPYRDARTDELTGHGPVSEVDELKRQLIEAWKERDEARAALRAAEAHMTSTHGCVCGCPVIDGHTSDCAIVAALIRAALGQDKGANNG